MIEEFGLAFLGPPQEYNDARCDALAPKLAYFLSRTVKTDARRDLQGLDLAFCSRLTGSFDALYEQPGDRKSVV